jgi:hypothetical protein
MSSHLAPQDVEVVRGRRAVDNLPVTLLDLLTRTVSHVGNDLRIVVGQL